MRKLKKKDSVTSKSSAVAKKKNDKQETNGGIFKEIM